MPWRRPDGEGDHCARAPVAAARFAAASRLGLYVSLALLSTLIAEGGASESVPEVNAFLKFSNHACLYLLGSVTRESGQDVTDGEIGAHLDFTIKPILRARLRQADWERERYFWVRVGYVVSGDLDDRSDGLTEHRGILEATGRVPLSNEVWLVNRLRTDLRDVDDESSQRYRYRLGIEREFTIGDKVWVPYAQAETFYDSRFDTWNRQLYQAGVEIVLTKSWRIELYFAHQHDQRSASANLNRTGLALKYYR